MEKQPKYLVMEYNYPISFVVDKEDYEAESDTVEFIPIKVGGIEVH